MGYQGILSGIRVIDCATYVAGPAAATIMSDFGADVIKVERPDGDTWRIFPLLPGLPKSELNWAWLLSDRNKRSIALDLTDPEGRNALIRLARTADVFLTNYQQILLDKFRLTWDDLRKENPRLIFAHITGYGDSGDDADAPAFDGLAYWARSGLLMTVVGRDGTPGGPRPAIGDHPTASSLFGAIMLALYNRERTGRGTKVSTSLMANGAWANGCDLQAKLFNAEFTKRAPGGPPVNPLLGGYMSLDGKPFMIALLNPEFEFPRLCAGIGQPDLATNELFSSNQARTENSAELFAILQSQFESRDLKELAAIFKEFDIKWSAFPLLEDVIADPQMRASGAFVQLEYPGRPALETINSPLFVEGEAKRKPSVAPDIGAHTREVLREAGYDEREIEAMVSRGIAVEAK